MANPEHNDLCCNDRYDDFLLAEYENIAKAYFDVKNSVSSFFRYYLLVMSIPISLLMVVVLKFENFYTDGIMTHFMYISAIAFIVISLAGHFMTKYIISAGLNSKIYAEQVNDIRGYFVSYRKQNGGIYCSGVLPIKAREIKCDSDSLGYLFCSTVVINTFYFSTSVWLFKKSICIVVMVVIVLLVVQYVSYRSLLKNRCARIMKLQNE